MHHVYSTEGFVLESLPKGEANRFYYIFTEDLGLLAASAQGVRLLKSKLRFHLEPYARVGVSCVKGKEIWRITNAREIEQRALSRDAKLAYARVLSLVRRLVRGEDKNEILYKALLETHEYLGGDIEGEAISAIEIGAVLKVLHSLGYVDPKQKAEKVVNEPFSPDLLAHINSSKKDLIVEINTSLRETQL
jgi:DNA repair protein RecO